MAKWPGTFEGSYYDTTDLIDDLKNHINHGIVRATPLSGGGVEVLEERSDGTTRLNIYYPKPNGGHGHYWVDSDGKTYSR